MSRISRSLSVSSKWAKWPFFALGMIIAISLIAFVRTRDSAAQSQERAAKGAPAFGFLFTVNSTGDGLDANSGSDANCADVNGKCTLRAAIQTANVQSGDDTIEFNIPTIDPGFSNGVWTISLGSVLPNLSTNITINGPGSDKLVVKCNTLPRFHDLNVTSNATVNISGLSVVDSSGGIVNAGTGIVTVNNILAAGNDGSGGVANTNSGIVVINSSAMNGNTTGVANTSSGSVKITSSVMITNAGLVGAAIFNSGSGSVLLNNSTVASNSVNGFSGNPNVSGGAIHNNGSLTILNSTFDNNKSIGYTNPSGDGGSASGGAIHNLGTALLFDSSFIQNSAAGGAASGPNAEGGASLGGAIYDAGSYVLISNCTFAGNTAFGGKFDSGGGGEGSGGGVYHKQGTLSLFNSTVDFNITRGGNNSSGQFALASGSGVDTLAGTVNVQSSIIAGNTTIGVADSGDVKGAFTSQGYNLIGARDGSTGFTQLTDQSGTLASSLNPRVDPQGWQSNGGPTQTIALLSDSPAIDKGMRAVLASVSTNRDASQKVIFVLNNAINSGGGGVVIQIDNEQMIVNAAASNSLTVTRGANGTTATAHGAGPSIYAPFDQRGLGFPRLFDNPNIAPAPFGDNSDIGAFERQSANPTTLQFSSATYSVNENGGTATITVTRTGDTSVATTVNYSSSNGTATNGADYTATNGTLSFVTGETSKTFPISIINDTVNESNETVNLFLNKLSGAAVLGSPSAAVLTINDDDPQPALS